jgi:hypothetical protein
MPRRTKKRTCDHYNCVHQALPGMTSCCEHTPKHAMSFWIQQLARRLKELGHNVDDSPQ